MRRRSVGTLAVAVAALGVAVQGVAAQAVAPATLATLADFAWLEGSWRGPGPEGGTAEIHYMSPTARVLPSVFRLWNGERVLFVEAITLVEDDDGITLYARHFTPALEPLEAERPITLELVAREGDRFVFENVYDGNPRLGVIERTGPDTFLSSSELLRDDGSIDEIRVEYRRAGGTGGN